MSGVTRKMSKEQKARRKFKPQQRVMGAPGQYGRVTGYTEDGHIQVWWDSGRSDVCSFSKLSLVKDEAI